MPWARRRRTALAGTAIACAAIALLFVPILVGDWAPLLHWTCQRGAMVATGVAYVPAVMLNSPFGGNATARGDIPSSFPGSLGYPNSWSFETDLAINGTSAATYNSVNISFFQAESVLALGPGQNTKCPQSLLALPTPPPYLITYAGWTVAVPSNLSDVGEADSVTPAPYGGYPVLTTVFDNGFARANEPPVSTCGTGPVAISLPHLSSSTRVQFRNLAGGQNLSVPFVLPFVGSYNYNFPAHFGTWQVDNLSTSGGPGGGWAFNFVGPCV